MPEESECNDRGDLGLIAQATLRHQLSRAGALPLSGARTALASMSSIMRQLPCSPIALGFNRQQVYPGPSLTAYLFCLF